MIEDRSLSTDRVAYYEAGRMLELRAARPIDPHWSAEDDHVWSGHSQQTAILHPRYPGQP
jgi:hypothetical protein